MGEVYRYNKGDKIVAAIGKSKNWKNERLDEIVELEKLENFLSLNFVKIVSRRGKKQGVAAARSDVR